MRLLLAALLLVASCTVAAAQGCGPTNPNCIVPTAPFGTNNNQAASTAFVQSAVSAGALPTINPAQVLGNNGAAPAVAFAIPTRLLLTGATTIYVNGNSTSATCTADSGGSTFTCAAGNDTTGSGTVAAPYKTLQKALNVAATYDEAGQQITIVLAYTTAGSAGALSYGATFALGAPNGPGGSVGGNAIFITGDASSPTSVSITAPSSNPGSITDGIYASDGFIGRLEYVQLDNQATAVDGLRVGQRAIVDLQGVTCGASWTSTVQPCLFVEKGGTINGVSSPMLTLAGCGSSFLSMTGGVFNAAGIIQPADTHTIAIPSAIACSTATVIATGNAELLGFTASTFTGTGVAGTTGTRALLAGAAYLNSPTHDAVNSIFPGNVNATLQNWASTNQNDPLTVPVPVASGGTGLSTLTSNTLYKGNGTGAMAVSSVTDSGTAVTVTSESFGLTGNISGAGIFGTNGIRYKNAAATLSDTTSSGTVANNYTNLFGGNTLTATSATTLTNTYGAYFQTPVCSTNVTCTNGPYAVGADSLALNLSTAAAAFNVNLSNTISVGSTAPVNISGTLTASAGSLAAMSINPTITGTSGGTGNTVNGVLFQPTFTPTASITAASGTQYLPTFNPGTGATITQANALNPFLVTGSGLGAITTGNALNVGASYGSILPTTVNGILIGNFGHSSITTSTALNISAQSGSTTNHGIVDNADFLLPNITNVATTSAVCVNTGTGLISYDGTIGTCTVSDGRLKKVDGPITGALDKLLQIHGVYFHWKDPKKYGAGQQAGIIAQDVQKVFPPLVSTDSEGKISADYQRLIAPVIEALRELKADNDNLRGEIERLKKRASR